MPEHGVRDRHSQCPFQLLIHDQRGSVRSAGSALFYEVDDKHFLITNWHIVSGRNFLNGKPLVTPSWEPLRITAKLAAYGAAIARRDVGSTVDGDRIG